MNDVERKVLIQYMIKRNVIISQNILAKEYPQYYSQHGKNQRCT